MANSAKTYVVQSLHEFMVAIEQSTGDIQSSEGAWESIASSFSCPKNPDVESFLKKQAFDHYRRRSGMTYLVFSLESGELVGYFALALRPFTLPLSEVTKSQRNRLRCCGLTALPEANTTAGDGSHADGNNTYAASAVLIGQLGRNYAAGLTESISGSELLDLAVERIHDIQDLAGGGLIIIEAEDHHKLIDFYERNGFKRFGVRHLAPTKHGAETALVQMFRLIGVRRSTLASESAGGAAVGPKTRHLRLIEDNRQGVFGFVMRFWLPILRRQPDHLMHRGSEIVSGPLL